MKTWKSSILILGAVSTIIMTSMSATAISDDTGDIWHWRLSDNQWLWGQYTEDKPNIDITDVSYSKDGLIVTLSLTVAGTIQSSEGYYYSIYLGNPNETNYWVTYISGMGFWGAAGVEGVSGGILEDPVSEDGKTLTATFDLVEDETFEAYGNAIEYSQIGDIQTSEWWQDWYPNSYFQGGNGGDGTDDDDDTGDDDDDTSGDNGDTGGGIPGFEVIALLVALGIALVILRRKK